MNHKGLLLLVFCALLVSTMPAFGATKPNDWLGSWDFTYSDSSVSTVTFTDVCVKPDCAAGGYWEYVAHGKKADNTDVQIRKIQFAPTQAMYYELSDTAISECGQDCPYATIPDASSDCNSFTVSAAEAPVTLASGSKLNVPETCATDNCTVKLIPGTVRRLLAWSQPVMPFIIIGDTGTDFPLGARAAFDSDAVLNPFINLRITKRLMVAVSIVLPWKLKSGTINVTAGDCKGALTVR